MDLFLIKNNNDYQLKYSYNDSDNIIYVWNNIPNNFSLDQTNADIKIQNVCWDKDDYEINTYKNPVTFFNKTKDEIINEVNRVINTLI